MTKLSQISYRAEKYKGIIIFYNSIFDMFELLSPEDDGTIRVPLESFNKRFDTLEEARQEVDNFSKEDKK